MTTLAHPLSFHNKRVLLKRSTHQINDPFVIKQKYKVKKSVQFSDNDQVRYFYKSHSPMQVNQEPPFMEHSVDDYQVIQAGWPARSNLFFNNDTKIRMENVQLVDGDYNTMENNQFILEGRCRALNLSFEKSVHVRYTTDLWKSYKEEQAQFHETIQSTHNTWDRFYFDIPIDSTLETQTIHMALRYTVDGQDHWDNNNGKNYELVIKPKESLLQQPQKKKEDVKILAQRYDFTASLSAARKPWSPPPSPPGSPLDDNNFSSYTPPIFFQHNSGLSSPPDSGLSTPIEVPAETLSKSLNVLSLQDPITHHTTADGYQMSYADFVNKYCFYNPHSTPIYSSSPVIS